MIYKINKKKEKSKTTKEVVKRLSIKKNILNVIILTMTNMFKMKLKTFYEN